MLEIFRWAALLAVIVLFVGITGTIVSSQPPSHPGQQQTSDKNNAEQPSEKPHKSLWDRWFPDAISLFTLMLVIFTAVLALAGIIQLKFLERAERIAENAANAAKEAANTASEALIANTRAWLAPSFVRLNTPLENGLPVSLQINIINTGREPAINAMWDFAYYLIPYRNPTNNPNDTLGPNTVCARVEPAAHEAGVIIYPESATKFWLPLEIPDTVDNRAIITAALERRESLVIEGCISYRTGGKDRKSWFRFFLRDVPGQASFVVNQGGAPVPNWYFNAMTTGNGAN